MADMKWTVGQTYWQAEGELHGRPCDLGSLAERCDRDTAIENARIWISDLSEREKGTAQARVREWEIIELDEYDNISCTVSTGRVIKLV